MKRRDFLKSIGSLAFTPHIPALTLAGFSSRALAAGPNYNAVNFSAPSVLPQVINIFLYGGPSELAGNLTNIADIEANSQNSYAARLGDEFLRFTNDPNGGQITQNGLWNSAGGAEMEAMLAANDMSIYRTLMKRKDQTRSHRESLFMSHKGALDIENSPGVGTRLAAMLYTHRNALASSSLAGAIGGRQQVSDFSNGLEGLPLPFVSFEGETTSYAVDPGLSLPLTLRGLTLDQNFDNPYSRFIPNAGTDNVLNNLVNSVVTQAERNRFNKASDSFELRQTMEGLIGGLQTSANAALPNDPDNPTPTPLVYPNNRFSARIRAAVTLAIENPSSLYITVGGGLGGWDDHNNGMDQYPERMQQLMQTLQVAMKHIRASSGTTPGGITRSTDNIVINMFGDFGRLVNLNGSNGWDHANNQNLYTFGGAGVRSGGAAAMGKIVGSTQRAGRANTNNQYTTPTSGSYEAEPMSVASSVYSYFGAQNPQVMTADPVLNPSGDAPINETIAGEATLF